MNKKQLAVALLTGVFLLSGCAKLTFTEEGARFTVPFDLPQKESDTSVSFKVIKVNIGEEFTIALGSDKTTGYEWQLAEPPDKNILLLVNSRYITDETKLIGSGGKEIWTFKALKAGKTIISFRYVRPWEKNIPPLKEKPFTIVIKER